MIITVNFHGLITEKESIRDGDGDLNDESTGTELGTICFLWVSNWGIHLPFQVWFESTRATKDGHLPVKIGEHDDFMMVCLVGSIGNGLWRHKTIPTSPNSAETGKLGSSPLASSWHNFRGWIRMGHANIIKYPDIFSYFFLTSQEPRNHPKWVEAPSTSKYWSQFLRKDQLFWSYDDTMANLRFLRSLATKQWCHISISFHISFLAKKHKPSNYMSSSFQLYLDVASASEFQLTARCPIFVGSDMGLSENGGIPSISLKFFLTLW